MIEQGETVMIGLDKSMVIWSIRRCCTQKVKAYNSVFCYLIEAPESLFVFMASVNPMDDRIDRIWTESEVSLIIAITKSWTFFIDLIEFLPISTLKVRAYAK